MTIAGRPWLASAWRARTNWSTPARKPTDGREVGIASTLPRNGSRPEPHRSFRPTDEHAFQFLGRNLETMNLQMQGHPEDLRKVMESTEASVFPPNATTPGQTARGQQRPAQSALLLYSGRRILQQVTGETAAKLALRSGLKDLGINIFDAHGKLRPLNDVMLQVANVFQQMPDGAEDGPGHASVRRSART